MRYWATSMLMGPQPSIHAGSFVAPSMDRTGIRSTGATWGIGGHTGSVLFVSDISIPVEEGSGLRTGGLAAGC